jgi:hypothetical protein
MGGVILDLNLTLLLLVSILLLCLIVTALPQVPLRLLIVVAHLSLVTIIYIDGLIPLQYLPMYLQM